MHFFLFHCELPFCVVYILVRKSKKACRMCKPTQSAVFFFALGGVLANAPAGFSLYSAESKLSLWKSLAAFLISAAGSEFLFVTTFIILLNLQYTLRAIIYTSFTLNAINIIQLFICILSNFSFFAKCS